MHRRTVSIVVLLLAAGCASAPRPQPLTGDDVARMAQSGESSSAIIGKLEATGTVIALSASDIIRLHERGVSSEVLDWMQLAQIDEIRRRQALAAYGYCWAYGTYFHPYVWPPY